MFTTEIEKSRLSIEKATFGSEKLSRQLEANKSSIVRFIASTFTGENTDLAKSIDALQKKLEHHTSTLPARERMKELLETLLSDESALVSVRAKIPEFYQDQGEKLAAYEKDQKTRDIQSIAQKNHCFFVHGITRSDRPENRQQVVKPGGSWEEKLDITLGVQPMIPTSTVRRGNAEDKVWAAAGVILEGGRATYAHPMDANTVAIGRNERLTLKGEPAHHGNAEIEERLNASIHRDFQAGHNEILVSEPKVAGIYFLSEDTKSTNAREDSPSLDEIREIARSRKLPVFILKDGNFFPDQPNGSSKPLTLQAAEQLRRDALDRIVQSTRFQESEVQAVIQEKHPSWS